MIFFEKKTKPIIFWVLIIIFFDIFGFIAYLVFGNRLKIRAKRVFLKKEKTAKNYLKYCKWYKKYNKTSKNNLNKKQNKLIKLLKNKYKAYLWHNNQIKIFNDSQEFLSHLIADLKNAKKYICLEFYIFSDDSTGTLVANELKKKAKDGVEVLIVHDALGCRKTSKKFWNDLKKSGVKVSSFFSSPFNLIFLNLKINYRNHRKLVCIDGKTSYIGGINLRDDHMGKDKKLTPWRDTHIKIIGPASYAIQNIFLNDYIFASNKKLNNKLDFYFPTPTKIGEECLQVLDSGAEKKEQQIKETYKHIIKTAKEFLYIETPYFVVDRDIINLLIEAKNRGVDVKIILPQIPDKKSVWYCGLYLAQKLIKSGIEVYLYNGFIHSKTLLCEYVLSIGSCNFDNRSFNLNFEATALLYSSKSINSYKQAFNKDIKNSNLYTKTSKMTKTKFFFAKLVYILFGKIF